MLWSTRITVEAAVNVKPWPAIPVVVNNKQTDGFVWNSFTIASRWEEDNSPNHYNIHKNTNYVEYDIGDLYMIIIDFL